MLDSFNHVFFLEGGSTASGSPRLPFVRHKNYYLFVNDNSIPTDQAIQSMLSSSFTTPAATPADSVPGAADAEPTNEGDDEVFQHFHLDRYCLPFVCIVCCSATENMFSIRFHDYKHTVETFYETHPEFKKEALKAIPVLPSTTNKEFSKMDKRNCYFNHFLLCIQDKLEFQLFGAKNQKRLSTIISKRVMQVEALVDNQRRACLLLPSPRSAFHSIPPPPEPAAAQPLLAPLPTAGGAVRHAHRDRRQPAASDDD